MTRTRRIATLSLVLTGTLLASACGGGGGFEDDAGSSSPASASGPVDLKMLIASSGDAETNAVKEAADAWAEETGNTVEVTVASDMNQQLAQGFAGGNPPDVFYLDAARSATTPSTAASTPTPTRSRTTTTSTSRCARPSPTTASSTACRRTSRTLALQINTDVVGGGRADRRRHPDRPGRSSPPSPRS